MPPLTRPLPIPKNAVARRSGQVNATRALIRKEKDNSETVVKENNDSEVFPPEHQSKSAIAGIGIGVTIPGPKNSYMSARIDVFCYLPSEPDDESMRATMDKASELVQERLEKEAEGAREYFNEAT